jgi:hypothetical protein
MHYFSETHYVLNFLRIRSRNFMDRRSICVCVCCHTAAVLVPRDTVRHCSKSRLAVVRYREAQVPFPVATATFPRYRSSDRASVLKRDHLLLVQAIGCLLTFRIGPVCSLHRLSVNELVRWLPCPVEELLARNCSVSGEEIRQYGLRDPLRWPRDTLSPQKCKTRSFVICRPTLRQV